MTDSWFYEHGLLLRTAHSSSEISAECRVAEGGEKHEPGKALLQYTNASFTFCTLRQFRTKQFVFVFFSVLFDHTRLNQTDLSGNLTN